MDLGLNVRGRRVSLTLEELVTLFISRKTNSVRDLESARQAGWAELRKDHGDHEETQLGFRSSPKRERDRERKRWVQVGACFTAGAKQALSPHHV